MKKICFTGHRPKSLPWGYDESKESCLLFKSKLRQEIESQIQQGNRYFISGLALGVDMIAAEIVLEFKHKYPDVVLEGAIPCPNQSERWRFADKLRYNKIVKSCDSTHLVCDHYTDDCMNERNRYMISQADIIIAIWNGKPSGTGNTVRFAKQKGCEVIIINPDNL